MLILTRRPGERVVIGDEILVTVMSVSGHTVRLGISAPAGVPIYREEIWLAVKEENRAAAAAAADAIPARPPAGRAQPPAAPGSARGEESAGAPAEEPAAAEPAKPPKAS
ncbi:MAG TPA: carbon storage regulator CsrA [Solirubrobacteraceae bacterium]|nr:carbon storage regulator CsrA [Solirubrobacteraceae bacterium]